jgi:uncharacterized membrane protein
MMWNRLFRLRSYLHTSFWIIPFAAIPMEILFTRLIHRLDDWLALDFLALSPAGAQAIFQTIITATLTFIVFTFSSLLVAVQIASGQMTPRIIATTLLRDRVVAYTVGLFIFTLLLALSAQNRQDNSVHQLVAFSAALLGIISFATFFYLIHYASRLLRPVSILRFVATHGLDVIESMYPDPSKGPDSSGPNGHALGPPDRVIFHQGTSETVLAVNIELLRAEAERAKALIVFVPRVGDFVATDEPLFHIHGPADKIEEKLLCAAVAFGSERTLQQDPTFALRIIVDIALKALSPAINDPTTAVLAIDQLHRLLRLAGARNLRTDEIMDDHGTMRVLLRTPNWEDFVNLAFTEIRGCGSNNLQIVRRLRAMIENLIQTLPPHRHKALKEQLGLLEREIEARFHYPEELALAHVADSQGLGGHC